MFDQKIESVIERSINAMFAFWSAMLTAQTVILSVSAAVITTGASSSSIWQFKLIGFMATICMMLLLLNFASYRMQYEAIGKRLVNLDSDLSESERASDLQAANTRYKSMRVIEIISAFGLGVEACLLAWVLVI